MPRILKDIVINEVASVDRGAGEGVKIVLVKRDGDDDGEPYWKRDFTQAQRDDAAKTGAAMPDGSFPIKNAGDLANAIRLAGKAKDPAAAKAHIKDRAKALGLTDKLPADWTKRDNGEAEMTPAEIAALVTAEVTKALAPATETIAKQAMEIAILKMSDAQKAYMANCDEPTQKKFAAMSSDERDAHMQKNPVKKAADPVTNEDIAKRDAELVALRKTVSDQGAALAAINLEKRQSEFKKRATDLGLTEADGELMRKAADGDAAAGLQVEAKLAERMKALKKQADEGGLFQQFGSQQGNPNGTAYEQLMAKAADLRKTADGAKLTTAQAFDKVYTDPANADLVAATKVEHLKKAA